ncbi:MAG: L-glutamate gamma-semialdehyde dehydrogenase [Myxococcales bacterium]|nr:L-glutamate gamma-semialdehyde dehydrogenase [Sorangiineae bacterium PRO1]MCL4748671.1 L-glutamate gamma-semialdehyde dehydrogenase [Myxococcales bacterium]
MLNALSHAPPPVNEPVLSYAPGTAERAALKAELSRLASSELDIPLIIAGKEVRTGKQGSAVMPHAHAHVLGRHHMAGPAEVQAAIRAAVDAQHDWARMSQGARAAIFLKAAELLAGKYRPILNAATMLGQSKTAHQAEIDAACELIDFFRFNVHFAERILAEQPLSGPGMWNQVDARPLEGFVFAVTPFNFTSIAGNLPTAPAILGNTAVWKPASTAVYSAHFIMQLLLEAGLPPGVINLVYGSGGQVGNAVLESPHLAGVHFTGSTGVFQGMWKSIGERIGSYRTYPRLVGETGGKDFIFAHESADRQALAVAIVRGAFEFQGQKCSAASRVYLPSSIADDVRERVVAMIRELSVGDIRDFSNFMGAVIDQSAYRDHVSYIEHARGDGSKILAGGSYDDKVGYFIQPTLVETPDPKSRLMREEIFGPVLTWYVYDAGKLDDALSLCDETSPYALTGAVFAQDRAFVSKASERLRNAAGNFYVNDKPTGAVVGQQPFGGARASGTNDKAGSLWNLIRWISPRTIKETFAPPTSWRYPFLAKD